MTINYQESLRQTEGVQPGLPSATLLGGIVKICETCDWWTKDKPDYHGNLMGNCYLFQKRTDSKHGLKCTGWEMLPND